MNWEWLLDAFEASSKVSGKPSVIIAQTIKGKGVSFMENQIAWHSNYLNPETYEQAMRELKEVYDSI